MTKLELFQAGQELTQIHDTLDLKDQYDSWCDQVKRLWGSEDLKPEVLRQLEVKMFYQVNEYSDTHTRNAIISALKDTMRFLSTIPVTASTEITVDMAIMLIEKTLINFHKYIKAMYRDPVHQNSSFSKDVLESIQIQNEYDLQRMLYSLLLPLFPTARQEVSHDSGYRGMRSDIFLDTYNLVIETKCTRESMSEKKLIEELAADGFLYTADTIIFFVYDRMNIIKNPDSLMQLFEREQRDKGKITKLYIYQPII